MWAGIGAICQILFMLLKWWFSLDDAKKQQVNDIVNKEVKDAKDAQSIVRLFNAVNRV